MIVNVAIIGAGEVAERVHLPIWAKIARAKVVAICDINAERAAAIANKWKVPAVYTCFSELLAREAVDVIDICTPPASHSALVAQALESGHHTIVEKPIAMSIEENEKILEVYSRVKRKLKLGILHNWLFDPLILKAEAIAKGMDILGARVEMLHTPDDAMLADPKHWCHFLPGGRFGECLIHPIYLLQHFLGTLSLKSIWVAKKGPYPHVPFDELHCTFDGWKRFGEIYISFNAPRFNIPILTLYGKEGILQTEGYSLTSVVYPQRGHSAFDRGIDAISRSFQIVRSFSCNALKLLIGRLKSGHRLFFELFIDSIINNKPSPLSPEEAIEANRTFLETLEALKYIRA